MDLLRARQGPIVCTDSFAFSFSHTNTHTEKESYIFTQHTRILFQTD